MFAIKCPVCCAPEDLMNIVCAGGVMMPADYWAGKQVVEEPMASGTAQVEL